MREREKMAPKRKPENEVLQENNCFQAANITVGGNCYNVTQECKNPCPRGANASY